MTVNKIDFGPFVPGQPGQRPLILKLLRLARVAWPWQVPGEHPDGRGLGWPVGRGFTPREMVRQQEAQRFLRRYCHRVAGCGGYGVPVLPSRYAAEMTVAP